MEKIQTEVVRIIASTLGVNESQVTENAEVIKDLGADSLDVTEIVMEAEEKCDVVIEDDDIANLKTVKQIVDYIVARKK